MWNRKSFDLAQVCFVSCLTKTKLPQQQRRAAKDSDIAEKRHKTPQNLSLHIRLKQPSHLSQPDDKVEYS